MNYLEERIQDAEIEISLAIGCIEWAETRLTIQQNQFLSEHLNHRIIGLEQALNTLKELDAIVHKEQADVHEPEKD